MYGFNFNRSTSTTVSPGGGTAGVGVRSLAAGDFYLNSVSPTFLQSYSSRLLSSSAMLLTGAADDDNYSAAASKIPDLNFPSPEAAAATRHRSTSSWPGLSGVDSVAALGSSATEQLLANLKRSSSESLYHQTLFGAHNTLGQTEAWFSTNHLVKRPRFDGSSGLPIYPQRPGEKDCAHYMLTRTCKFGDSCKFDHPIWVPEGGIPDWQEVQVSSTELFPQRPGEPDCPFFLKTQKCKFGTKCKFNHPKKINLATLPERPTEPPCAFYMKTGICKFGAVCKFHHPKDIQLPGAIQENNNSDLRYNNGTNGDLKPITPALMHNTKGLPIRLGEVDCPFYLKTGSCKYGQTCRFNHPDRNSINPPAAAVDAAIIASPAQHLSIGFVNPAASILQNFAPRLTQTTLELAAAVYPQRPGELECDFFMKTGECKFGQRCRFHHPIDRTAPTMASALKEIQLQQNLNLTGLPRREGAIRCPYYMKTGTCKYGRGCRFDHPPPGEVMASMATTTRGASTSSSSGG
ncbi:OLC1v1022189C1 [Oldenlandia corymbosa var. corymbosa]|uniref:OLC1v1022189C1 n=1 Tax=Oldenlandia corymbosa var. corymbosa TaxID=529605 RepID=A0AAV1BXA9_OLDCO|nr:OLC1v1022189C1 [Oldenlandia corymbosa var. corymbosa]